MMDQAAAASVTKTSFEPVLPSETSLKFFRRYFNGTTNLFGQLYFICSYSALTDAYTQPSVEAQFRVEPTREAIRHVHEEVFMRWVLTPLYRQAEAIVDYCLESNTVKNSTTEAITLAKSGLNTALTTLKTGEGAVLQEFLFNALIPPMIYSPFRQLFIAEMPTLLIVLTAKAETAFKGPTEPHFPKSFTSVLAALYRAKEEHGKISLNANDIARDCGTTSAALGRAFKHQIGTSFRRYLRAVRMVNAAALLCGLSKPLKEIAGQLGYTDTANFSNDFYQTFDLSPQQYRIKQQIAGFHN